MSFLRNDVVLLPIPFSDLTSRKVRPAVMIGRNSFDLFPFPSLRCFTIPTWPLLNGSPRGLNVACGIKAQLVTVEDRLVVKMVGSLSALDQEMLNQRLRAWLQL